MINIIGGITYHLQATAFNFNSNVSISEDVSCLARQSSETPGRASSSPAQSRALRRVFPLLFGRSSYFSLLHASTSSATALSSPVGIAARARKMTKQFAYSQSQPTPKVKAAELPKNNAKYTLSAIVFSMPLTSFQ
eukprot:5313508-Pleurochrysis_carterae.AAC.1